MSVHMGPGLHVYRSRYVSDVEWNRSAPYSKASEVWGEDNFNRLLEIKTKYDPQCLFNRGRVIATDACVAKGLATTSL